MGNTFTVGSVGASFTNAGPVYGGGANISLSYGIKQPKGIYALAKASVEDQSFSNSFTKKNFTTKPYTGITGEIGYNHDQKGPFVRLAGTQKVGIEKNTKIMKDVGEVLDFQGGMRFGDGIKLPEEPVYEAGACFHSETHSSRGHNLKYEEKFVGPFVGLETKNIKVSLAGGGSNMGGKWEPAIKATLAYIIKSK